MSSTGGRGLHLVGGRRRRLVWSRVERSRSRNRSTDDDPHLHG